MDNPNRLKSRSLGRPNRAFVLGFFLLTFALVMLSIWNHEEMHREVYAKWGIESTINYLSIPPYTNMTAQGRADFLEYDSAHQSAILATQAYVETTQFPEILQITLISLVVYAIAKHT